MEIRYAFAASAFGTLLVAAAERGVCAVTIGDDESALATALHAEFPGADVARADADERLVELVDRVRGSLTGGRCDTIPLDVRGTEFQQRVWSALQAIPRGETRTYGAVARAIGTPAAVRAVGSACARNRVALVIPCHRVVREDGMLGGYRWGVERKRRILEMERGEA